MIESIKKIDCINCISINYIDELVNEDLDKSQNPSDDVIQLNINNLYSGNFELQLESIKFFEFNIYKYDIILPPKYLEITMNLFRSNLNNNELIDFLLKLYRHCTGFQSEMQDFLAERNIIDLIYPFLPSNDVLAIYGNLAIPNGNVRKKLLSMDILSLITQIIIQNNNSAPLQQINMTNFEFAVNCLNCLIFKLDDFDYTDYLSEFINIFEILHSLYANAEPQQANIIIRAFSDYIDAHPVFIEDFLTKDQLRIFLEKDFNDNKIYRWILDIIMSIIYRYGTLGAGFLNEISIVDWIERQLFSESQEVVLRCFCVLTNIINNIDQPYIFADECINRNFLVMAIDKFYSETKYHLKTILYGFVCSIFSNATTSQIPLILDDKALDLIIDNYEFVDELNEDILPQFISSLQRILMLYQNKDQTKSIVDAFDKIKQNDELLDRFWNLVQTK